MQWIVEHQQIHWRNALKHQIKPSKIVMNNYTEDTSPEQYVQETVHQSTLSIEVLDPSSKTY